MLSEMIEKAGEYFMQGGWIMFPIAAASIAMWGLIIDRFMVLRRFSSNDMTMEQAISHVREGRSSFPGESLRSSLLSVFSSQRTGDPGLDREILHHTALRKRQELGRSLAVIAVLAGIAPLLGLLGTVLGMIETFEVISLFGTGNAQAMAGGISVALVTTQTGLLVAIPGLFFSGVLNRKASRLRTNLDEAAEVLGRVIKKTGRIDIECMNEIEEQETLQMAGDLQTAW